MMRSSYRLKSTLGGYEPSFFRIELQFPFGPGQMHICNLTDKQLSVYVHEYIHFIQDISTFTGLNNAYVYSEYIHGVVNQLYKNPKGKIKVPINLPWSYGNIKLNQFVNQEALGWTDEEVNNLFILAIKKESKIVPFVSFLKSIDQVYISQVKGKRLPFGTHAIRESMAYILEKAITRGSPSAADYPYNSASLVANFIYPAFCTNELNVLALCDMCLQFSAPGRIFVDTLYDYKRTSFNPQDPREIYDYFYQRPCTQMRKHVDFLTGLIPFGIFVGGVICDYLNDSEFYDFHRVVRRMIGTGMKKRLESPYFMIEIAETGENGLTKLGDNYPFFDLYYKTGTPIVKDSLGDYYITPPIGMPGNTSVSYFQAIQQFIYLFQDGNTCCSLYEWCEKSPDIQEDDRCIMEPWNRCGDNKMCPFAMLWRHWKLKGYEPEN